MGFEILRIEKLKTMADVVRSSKHTFREQDTPNAIPDNSHPNTIEGPKKTDSLVREIHSLLHQIDKVDKQAVVCVEYLVTASKETMKGIDPAVYLDDALKWIKDKHGERNVICSVIHHDEKAPHLVAYVVPVVAVAEKTRKRSVMAGGSRFGRKTIDEVVPAHTELSAKHFFGGSKRDNRLSKLQDEFHEAVGAKHGLDRGVKGTGRKNVKPAEWYEQKDREQNENQARLDALSAELAAQKVKLDDLAATLADDRRRLDLDTTRLVQEGKDLAKLKSELIPREAALDKGLSDLQRRSVELELQKDRVNTGQEAERDRLNDLADKLEDQKADMDLLEQQRAAKIAEVKATIGQWERDVKRDRAALNQQVAAHQTATQGHTPEQVAGALVVVTAFKAKTQEGMDMNNLKKSDIVILQGSRGAEWAKNQGLVTAEDLAQPASPNEIAWAERMVKTNQQTALKAANVQGVKR